MATPPKTFTAEDIKDLLNAKSAASDMALDFRDMRDFSKQVASHLKNMGKDAEKLTSSIKQTAANVASATNMMDIFRAKSIASRFAAQEIANGIGLTKDRMKKLNTEAEKYAALEKATAEDRILGESLVKSLTDELGVSQKKLLDSKTALLGVDARILTQARAQWEMSGKNLAQLEAQAAKDQTQLAVEDKRLEILEQRRRADFELEQSLQDIAKQKRRATTDEERAALDQERAQAIKDHEEKMKHLEAEYNATGTDSESGKQASLYSDSAKTQLKDLDNQTRNVARFREQYYQQLLVNQALLAESEEEQHTKDLLNLKTRMGYSAHFLRTEDTNLGLLGQQFNAVKGFLNKAKLIPPQFMLLDFILKSSYDRFIALDKAAEDFRKLTGFSNTQMKELRKDAEAVNLQFAQMGVSIENVYKSAKALTDIFGRTSLVSKEALKNVSLLSVNLGVSEESSANVLSTFQGLGGATEEAAMNIIKVGAGLSEKTGVPFKLVMQDVANASEETLKMIGANPSQLMKAAIAARSMGLELNKVMATQRKLLDFNSSITDELEASAMLGKNINFQLARQLAFEGRVEDSQRAILDTVKRAGDFNRMNVYQREALAKASGMELKDLTKMMAVDSQREAILNGSDESKRRILRAQEEELKKLKERNKLDSEDLVMQNQKALMQQKMQGIMTKLKNIFDSISAAMGDILEPIITPLAAVLIPAFRLLGMLAKAFGFVLKVVLYPLTWIAELLGGIANAIDGVISSFEGFGETAETVFKILIGGIAAATAVLFIGKKGWISFGQTAKTVIENTGTFINSLKTKATWTKMFSGMGTAFTNGWKSVKDAALSGWKTIQSIWRGEGPKLGESLASGAGSLKDKFKNIFGKKGAAQTVSSVGETVGAGAAGAAGVGGAATKAASTAADASKTVANAATSAEAVRPTAGLGLRVFLTNLSAGLRSMAGTRVLGGALNLIPASIGLIAMIPGYLGALLLSALPGPAIALALTSLAAGLTAMGTVSVFAGAAALLATSAALVVSLIGLPAMLAIAFLGAPFSAGLIAMSAGLSAIGANPLVWVGIAVLGAISLAFVGFGFAIKLAAEGLKIVTESFDAFSKVDFSTLAKIGAGILIMSTSAAAAGMLSGLMIVGAGALLILSYSLGYISEALVKAAPSFEIFSTVFEKILKIDGTTLLNISAGIASLGVSLAGMAVFALPMLISVGVLSLFFGVLEKAKPSLDSLSVSLESLSKAFEKISKIDGTGLFSISAGITTLGASLAGIAVFALPMLVSVGIFSLFFSTLEKAKTALDSSSASLEILSNSFQKISNIDTSGLFNISKGIASLGISLAGMSIFALPMMFSIGILSLFFGVLEKAKPSLDSLSQSLEKLQSINADSLKSVASGLGSLTSSMVLMSRFAASIFVTSFALDYFSKSVSSLGTSIEPIDRLSKLNLGEAAKGIEQLGFALARFGSGSAAAGVGSLVGRLLGGDPIKRLEKFSEMGDKLKETAESINTIASSTAKFGMVDAFADAVSRLVFSLERLNDQLDKTSTIKVASLSLLSSIAGKGQENAETTPPPATGPSGVEAKLDELITLLKDGGISVNLDGDKVSRSMASRGRE